MIITNLTQLRTINPQSGVVDVLGHTVPSDGGGGRFFFDASSAAPDDDGTILATPAGGRWRRIYAGPVNVDWFGAAYNATLAFAKASIHPAIDLSPRTYEVNLPVSIKHNQVWRFNGATVTHTDKTKTIFSAVGVNNWGLVGPGRLIGMREDNTYHAEQALVVTSCNRYRVFGITAQSFAGTAFHITAGTSVGSKSDQGQWADCAALDNMDGLKVDADGSAEYCQFSNLNATGNYIGVTIGAGNTTLIGGNICDNIYGLYLVGGPNHGHGIATGININHNATANIKADGVVNGFTFDGCHVYGAPDAGIVQFCGGTTDVLFNGGVMDAPVINDTGTNQLRNSKLYGSYSVGGSLPSGLVALNNF